jgi:sugar transferase (PEP-CTERM system associated)
MVRFFSHYVPGRMIVLAALEALVILAAAYVALLLYLSGYGGTISSASNAVPHPAAAFALGMILVMSVMGLYQTDSRDLNRSVLVRQTAAFVLGYAIMWLVVYLVPSLTLGPVVLGNVAIIALAGSLLLRAAFQKWSNADVLKSRVLVLGTGTRATKFAEYAQRNQNHQVIGYVSLEPATHYVPDSDILPMAPEDTLLSVVKKHSIDKIVLAVRDRRGGGFPLQQLLECRAAGVQIVELPTFFEREYRQVILESLNPSWMVLGDGFHHGWLRRTVKRVFDLTASAVLLLLTLPVILITALCIYLESRLPVLYRQERVGQGGRVFTLYKFRSMKMDAEGDGTPHWAKANDDRVTRVGRFIRKWRIDELPQIFNVLQGHMSIIGPRPEWPFFVDQLVKQIPYYELRHSAKPGITGWAQVRYDYGASVDDAIEKLQHDLYYVKNQCLLLDILILISTVEVVLWGRGAR